MFNFNDDTSPIPPQLSELIKSPLLERLKEIHQNGTDFLIDPRRAASRFEHSVGVMRLVAYLGGTIEEQAYGLLHDVKHTALSHFIDVLMEQSQQDYHDKLMKEELSTNEIRLLLQNVGLSYETVFSKENTRLTKAKAGMLGADRLDYFFRDGLAIGLLNEADINTVSQNITVSSGEIMCQSEEVAYWLGTKFIQLNEEVYFNPLFEAGSLALVTLCKDALANRRLSLLDFNLSDSHVIKKIGTEDKFKHLFKKLATYSSTVSYQTPFSIHRKYRYLDPLILKSKKKLSEVNPKFHSLLIRYLSGPKEVFYTLNREYLKEFYYE